MRQVVGRYTGTCPRMNSSSYSPRVIIIYTILIYVETGTTCHIPECALNS